MSAPKRFPDRDEIAAVRAEADALDVDAEAPTTRRLAGRVLARRDMGKLMFLDLVDLAEKSRRCAPKLSSVDPKNDQLIAAPGKARSRSRTSQTIARRHVTA